MIIDDAAAFRAMIADAASRHVTEAAYTSRCMPTPRLIDVAYVATIVVTLFTRRYDADDACCRHFDRPPP